MKLIKYFLFTAFSAVICLACQSNNGNEMLSSLKGTQWKLAGIVDSQTDKLTVLEPADCEECYTLTFDTDTTAEGLAYKEKIALNLSLLGQYMITDIGRTDEDNTFIRTLYSSNTIAYSFTPDKLKFINYVNHYYLLFKRV